MLVRIVGTAVAIALFGALTVLGASQHAHAESDAEVTCQASSAATAHIERR